MTITTTTKDVPKKPHLLWYFDCTKEVESTKYFVNADDRMASGHENYTEFQLPAATKEFWDESSLYMDESIMNETGFYEFWLNGISDDLVFDMCSLSKDELKRTEEETKQNNNCVNDIIMELKGWADTYFIEQDQIICVNWPFDRILALRRARYVGSD